jgi:hypothetical protein
MNLDCFRRQFHTKVLSRAKELQPLTNIWGTNSPLIQHTINLAVSCLKGTDEAYFEIGLLYGSSLDAASRGNDDVHKFACDIQVQGEVGRLIDTIPNLKFHLGDYTELDLEKFLGGRKIGTYYYDGDHSYEATIDAFERIVPYLADEAIIICDDLNYNRVANAWRIWHRDHSYQFQVLHEFWTPDQFIGLTRGYPQDWWDSFGISTFVRDWQPVDPEVENIAISVWHSTPPYEGRHNFVYPKELKHIHGKEEMHISKYNEQETGFVIKR